jgi:hypothetical protein
MDLLLRLAFVLVLFCFPAAAIAQEPHHDASAVVGAGVVCDSAQQVERYAALKSGGAEAAQAIELVNTEANNPEACALLMIAFIPRAEVGNVTVTGGVLRVMEITVVAAATKEGWNSVPSVKQYTAVFVKTEEV